MKFTLAIVSILAAAGIVDALALNTVTQLDADIENEFGFGGLADRMRSKIDEAKKKAEEAREQAEKLKASIDIDTIKEQFEAGIIDLQGLEAAVGPEAMKMITASA